MTRILLRRTLLVLLLLVLGQSGARSAPGDLLLDYIPFSTIAPQDLTYDPVEDCFWITAFLDDRIYKFSSDLGSELETIPSPFATFEFQTGIAYNSIDDTLLVTSASSGAVVEIDKTGAPTDRRVTIPFDPEEPTGRFTVRSLSFDAAGDDGNGSLWAVEALGTGVYEFTLSGERLRVFAHPEDPDGFPGEGRHAAAAGLDLIRDDDGAVEGYWLTGVRNNENRLLQLDESGDYTGRYVSLNAAGGTVSNILRHSFPSPDGEPLDAWICVVESNARFAILEAGVPTFREIFGLSCEVVENDVELSWESRHEYDAIEILRGCEVVATLPGDATSWESRFETDGVYRLSVRATSGDDSSEIGPCTLVVGAGQIQRSRAVEGDFPADLFIDEDMVIAITDATERQLLFFDGEDVDAEPISVVPVDENFAAEDEFITGISGGPARDDIFIYNTTTHRIGLTDFTGEVFETVEARLPNINEEFDPEDPESEPDFGVVFAMVFDARADDGEGNFLVVEAVRDRIYRLDRQGNLVAEIESPFRLIEQPPVADVFSTYTSGLSLVPGHPDLLWVTGGTYRDRRQEWIALIEASTGEVLPGTLIPTDALRVRSGVGSFAIENVESADGEGSESRFFVLSLARSRSEIFEIDHELPPAPAPVYLNCRQQSYANDVELSFVNNGPYSSIEVFRDCEQIATIAGDAERFVDQDVPTGVRDYSIRGVRDDVPGDFARCRVRVGLGAVLERRITWPARSPQQIARDPVDGSFYLAVNWPNEERKVFHFDRHLEFLGERESSVDPARQISSLAVRVEETGQRLLYFIDWLQPVPLGEADSQRFFLVAETLAGERVDEFEIFPPRPTNGFLTYPTALTWDPESDTFFYLERNSKTFVRITARGEQVARFPHPAPPFQNFVFNLGLTVVPERQTLLFTTSLDTDHGVTVVREMTFEGELTGFEFPLRDIRNEVRDIESVGAEVVAVGTGAFWEILRLRATEDAPEPFVRGDSDHDGRLTLSDAVSIHEHLFRGGETPACEDGADADDSGSLSITDAVLVLGRLFQGQETLPAPHPEPGQDPTPDGLGCS